ncbi:ATP-binding cassette domain-containing protein [Marinihelvus fidelis]|uniref:Probable ATP-binding protein YheS n=1 Tax=Marinihelvus fidelis TaxID=2613842 RepID=A0A5N0T851_9GAMM|nr:ATP-binding cassette domain-containing protein [Marinihelvus fidelis]KAA9130898.1 ATP-binding cassette domain-containing protein [Marinihelvus fidelis]
MIRLQDAALRRGPRILFEGATFQAHAGQRVGVVGANGSGKSSMFALLRGELETDAGEATIGQGLVMAHVRQESPDGGQSALDYVLDGDAELRRVQAGIARAEAGAALCENELHALYESMERIDGYGAEARAGRLLHGLGFAADEVGNPVSSFSGGWRMRLNLAQALMCRSDILLLDEPTNHLDLPAILWLERQLKAYEGILMVISHDRDFLDGVCTRILHIEHQAITAYAGNYTEFEARRAEQLAQQQAMFERQQKDLKHLQSFVDRFRYKASKAKQAQSRLKMMERMQKIAPAHADSPFRFRFMAPERQPQHLLKLEGARLGYGDSVVLDGVGLSISAGDRLGLLGVNGAGKSTLVKALADGATVLGGERVAHRDTHIGYFAQHQLEQLNPDQSPFDHLQRLMPGEREADLRNFLGRFGFSGERIFEPVAPFSGGEKARLVLALMIRQQPNLLLLDEPTNHLDLEMRQALSVALMEYDGALVVIAHDRHLLRSVCDELLIVHDGGVETFDRSLDDYAAWLRERESGGSDAPGDDAAPQPANDTGPRPNRREERRLEAEKRQRLKPLTDRVREVEKQLEKLRGELEKLEQQLADEALYTDGARKDELTELVRRQGEARAAIDDLEWTWLEASEKLEAAAG